MTVLLSRHADFSNIYGGCQAKVPHVGYSSFSEERLGKAGENKCQNKSGTKTVTIGLLQWWICPLR